MRGRKATMRKDDVVSVSTNGKRYGVDLWTADGDAIYLGTYGSQESAETIADAVYWAIEGWVAASR